jgi:hypothetical protein
MITSLGTARGPTSWHRIASRCGELAADQVDVSRSESRCRPARERRRCVPRWAAPVLTKTA